MAFFLNLILTSWSVGIVVSGLVLRNGMGAESLAWTVMFLLMPLTCVYYPVSVLPHWLQWSPGSLPPTYVFEGMRALVLHHVFRADLMLEALRAQRGLFCGCSGCVSCAARQRPPHGSLLQAANRRAALIPADLIPVAAPLAAYE